MSRVRIYNLQFSVTLSPGEVKKGQEERQKERKLRGGNIISNAFMIYLFPAAAAGNFISAAGGPRAGAAWWLPALPLLLPGLAVDLFSATGQDITGLLEVGALGPQGTWPPPHKQNSLEPK